MKHIVGTTILHTTVTTTGDGKQILATREDIRDAAELAAAVLRESTKLEVIVLLSDGTQRRVMVNMNEVGA